MFKLKVLFFFLCLITLSTGTQKKYIKFKPERVSSSYAKRAKLHSAHRKKHKKRGLFSLPGVGGPSYTDNPKWELKALNMTTKIPIVVAEKKIQHPLFIVPQIIG